jgi:hypothetical protein
MDSRIQGSLQSFDEQAAGIAVIIRNCKSKSTSSVGIITPIKDLSPNLSIPCSYQKYQGFCIMRSLLWVGDVFQRAPG